MSVSAQIFVADLFNTAFVMLIVYGLISGYPAGLFRIPFLFNGQLPDFTKPWYSSVGATLCQTMALKAAVAHLKKPLLFWAGRAWTRLARGAAATQERLSALHARPPFRLAERYGELHSFLFITVVFSPGLPILVWFFVAYCVVRWCCCAGDGAVMLVL